MRRLAAIALTLGLGSACAVEGAPDLEGRLAGAEARASAGLAKVHRALETPSVPTRVLGEGVQAVEEATGGMAQVEDDLRAPDALRLRAALEQAQAWEDLAAAFEHAPLLEELDSAQRDVLAPTLEEKAFPARVAARHSYSRALSLLCAAATADGDVEAQILAGLGRLGGDASEPACR